MSRVEIIMDKISQFCFVLILRFKQYSCDSDCSLQEFKCGDICIPRISECYCGTDEPSADDWDINRFTSLSYDEYGYRCWLTSEKDTCYQENGHGFYINGT